MVSERACLDIMQLMSGRTATITQTFFPGSTEERRHQCTEEHAATESDLYRQLLPRYDLQVLGQSIKWLTLCEYLGKTELGLRGPWVYTLSEKGQRAVIEGKIASEDHALLYQVDPHGVFIAQQFNPGDHDLVNYLKEEELGRVDKI